MKLIGPCSCCRFDRQIAIDRPDINGREHIFRIHLAKLRLDKPMDHYSERLAALTPGFAGADIANVANEAALIAARAGKEAVGMQQFEAAVDRVIGGLEKKHKVCVPAACMLGLRLGGSAVLQESSNPLQLWTALLAYSTCDLGMCLCILV